RTIAFVTDIPVPLNLKNWPMQENFTRPLVAREVTPAAVAKFVPVTATKFVADAALPSDTDVIAPESLLVKKLTAPVGLTRWTTTLSHPPISRVAMLLLLRSWVISSIC